MASFLDLRVHDSYLDLPMENSDAQREDTRMADWEHDCCAVTGGEDTVGREAWMKEGHQGAPVEDPLVESFVGRVAS